MAGSFSYVLSPTITTTGTPADQRASLLAILDATVPTDWALDFTTYDVAIPRRIVRGADAILQRCYIRLRFVLGEWFLDQRLGIPWYQRIFIRDPDIREIQRIFTNALTSIPGVSNVTNMVCTIDKVTRRLSVNGFQIQVSDVAVLRVDSPFIV